MAEKSGFRPAHDTWPEFIGKLAEGSMLGSLGLACETFAATAIPDEHLDGVITTLRGIQEKAKEDPAAKVAGLIEKLEARPVTLGPGTQHGT